MNYNYITAVMSCDICFQHRDDEAFLRPLVLRPSRMKYPDLPVVERVGISNATDTICMECFEKIVTFAAILFEEMESL